MRLNLIDENVFDVRTIYMAEMLYDVTGHMTKSFKPDTFPYCTRLCRNTAYKLLFSVYIGYVNYIRNHRMWSYLRSDTYLLSDRWLFTYSITYKLIASLQHPDPSKSRIFFAMLQQFRQMALFLKHLVSQQGCWETIWYFCKRTLVYLQVTCNFQMIRFLSSISCTLTHLPLKPHICVSESGPHRFR